MPELPADLPGQVEAALREDVGSGDVTATLVPAAQRVRGAVITREDAVLCGRAAPSFSVPADPLLEARPPDVPVGLPGQMLTRRPDVAEAEQNIVSFNAQVGVATADFYPTFTLTGSAGSINRGHRFPE